MEELLFNTRELLELLRLSNGHETRYWDINTLRKAFKWMKFSETVYLKLREKPVRVQDLIDQNLAQIHLLPVCVSRPLNIEFYKEFDLLLSKALLQNPYLHTDLYAEVLKHNQRCNKSFLVNHNFCITKSIGTSNHLHGEVIFNPLLEELNQAKEAVTHICHIKESLSSNGKNAVSKPEFFLKMTEATLFLEYLSGCFQESFISQGKKTDIEEQLIKMSTKPGGMEIIATIPLATPLEDISQASLICKQIVLQWLLDTQGSSDLWQLPGEVLTRLSGKYFKFFTAYLSHLIQWGNSMEFEADTEQWRNDENNSLKSFENLTRHFHHLIGGPLHSKHCCTKALQSMTNESSSPNHNLWIAVLRAINDKSRLLN